MKKYACQYAIVRFLPYLETGEFANVGIVLFCPESGYFGYKLMSRVRARITAFFEELDGKVYREALETFEWELSRIKDYFHDEQRMIIRKTGWDTNIFIELTRPRETMLRFDGVRVKLTEAPERELEDLFLHYVERTFVTKKYQEQLVEEAVRKVLKTGKLNERYKKYIFGSNDTYHATFPFVYLKEKTPIKAIKPLNLSQKDPTKIFDHGCLWVAKIGKLQALRLLPDDLLLPVQGPLNATGPQSDSFQEVMCQLKKMALVVEAKEKQKILDFAII